MPNSSFIVRQIWMAASLNSGCRPRLPVGVAYHGISGSNQIDSKPRRFSAELYNRQFFVLYFTGVQLLMAARYHHGFKKRIPSAICATKPNNALTSKLDQSGEAAQRRVDFLRNFNAASLSRSFVT